MGTWYKRIAGHTGYEAANKAVNHYIASVVLEDFLKQGELILEENAVLVPALNNRRFEVATWSVWLEEEANLYLGDESNQWVYLELQGRECVMYRTIRWRGWEPAGELISRELIAAYMEGSAKVTVTETERPAPFRFGSGTPGPAGGFW
jgi:hypothetical protein